MASIGKRREHLLTVSSLSCRYGEHKVLNGVNLKIRSGEAVAIVGKSGSGKTTLAYALCGIIPRRVDAEVEGEVKFDEFNLSDLSFQEILRNINIVLEDYEAQIFGLTVEEDIVFGLENLGISRKEISEKLKWVLEFFGLEKYRSYEVSELSGGMKQRLCIASTTILSPSFLILDNPTSNLDWEGVVKLSQVISRLKEEGMGIILMLRKLKGFEKTLDRIYQLRDGKLRRTSYEKLSRPYIKHKYVEHPPSEVPIIEFRDVWFRYNGPYVLQGINMKVYEGEVVALMGRNGSGKTTMMKLIDGLLMPERGKVIVAGREISKLKAPERAKIVGLAFQDPLKHIFSETVWDEVSFGCRKLGMSLENARKALFLMKLEKIQDRETYKLSMGEKVRTVVASALALNPKVLLLDEPTTGQDYELLGELIAIVRKVSMIGKTVIIVTHDSDFALSVADRVTILNHGKIVRIGKADEVLMDRKLLSEAWIEPPYELVGGER